MECEYRRSCRRKANTANGQIRQLMATVDQEFRKESRDRATLAGKRRQPASETLATTEEVPFPCEVRREAGGAARPTDHGVSLR